MSKPKVQIEPENWADMLALIVLLGHALKLTKADAEKHGFTYGPQSVCQQALTAYDYWVKP